MRYWAYLHSNGAVHVKRYFPASRPENMDDREYALQEMHDGNDFIRRVTHLFSAEDQGMAYKIATELLLYDTNFKKEELKLVDKFSSINRLDKILDD